MLSFNSVGLELYGIRVGANTKLNAVVLGKANWPERSGRFVAADEHIRF